MSEAVEVRPLERPPDATVRVPGSKSITNRALLIAALGDGTSELGGALFSDDTLYMAAALRELGIGVEDDRPGCRFRVPGRGGRFRDGDVDLQVGNAGTAMRFLTAALALGRGRMRIDGNERMRERPIQDLIDALRGLGVEVRCEHGNGCPPVIVEARGGLDGGEVALPGDRSSQFLSAVLQVAPLARRDVTVVVPGRLIARPYVDMTVAVMRAFGVEVEEEREQRFHVHCGQRYRGCSYRVEPDASAAHYFWAAAALTGGRVRTDGLGRSSLQGDVGFAALLERMGATVHWRDDRLEVVGGRRLDGIDVDLNPISDTMPTLAVLAPFASGPIRIRNIEHVRWQESDRIAAVAAELRRLGARVDERRDGLEIHPGPLHGAEIHTYDDHRIAMAFALVGLRVPGVRISDPGCVGKTFPDYFECLEELRR